ncbi:OmpA family protein [Neolewinella persica]|uniref:OmpA family protein n=1 Tax=Neolewinella persica TaxID=70998 RepID=UPI00035D9BBE|nr:OmpA family protein [Neolewinella persica]
MTRSLLLVFLAIMFVPALVCAQTDVPGAEDHPLLTRYPGSQIAWYQTEKYFEYDLATGPITSYRYIKEREQHAGQLYRIYYEITGSPEEVSIGEVYADYLRAFQDAGITVINKALRPKANEFGGSQWIGVALGKQQPPNSSASKLFAGTASAGGKFALMGRVDRPSGPVYVAIYGERHSSKLVNFLVDILETKDAELGKVSLDPDYLADELAAKGSVSIYGIEFDFDSAKLKPASDEVIAEIAAYLVARPQVQLFVVGHTDMTGNLNYNRKLSLDRATAVVNHLETNHRIAKGRLTPDGVAFLAPKANNSSEDGRALNRRVELVLRK